MPFKEGMNVVPKVVLRDDFHYLLCRIDKGFCHFKDNFHSFLKDIC